MTEDDHHREVYAHFGLAVYMAQVLEHGIVNALVICDLVPKQRKKARTRGEWEQEVDQFMDRHFEAPLGRLLNVLRSVMPLPAELEGSLRHALKQRNFLVHNYFRERATRWASESGRNEMIGELRTARDLFQTADQSLGQVIRPFREKIGLTDEVIERVYSELWEASHESDEG